jgi:hypothetical protein
VGLTAIQHTSAPRPGRRFEPTHEAALESDALAACGSLPGAHRGVIVVREMAGPIGIPDFTAMVGGSDALQARSRLDVPPILNETDAAIVAVASARIPKTVDGLAQALGWPVTTVARRVPGLLSRGALLRPKGDRYLRPEALQPAGRIYAIETKVRDRVAAVNQARAYLSWADSYVLVMGQLGRGPLDLITTAVRADNGGLVVAGTWIRRPRLSKRNSRHRVWAAEHFFAAMGGAHIHPSVRA